MTSLSEALSKTGPASRLWDGQKDGRRSLSRARRALSLLLPEEDLSPQLVSYSTLQRVKQGLVSQGLGPASVNRHMSALSRCLTWARNMGLIAQLPQGEGLPEPRARDTVLTQEQLAMAEGWVSHEGGPVYGRFLRFLWETGVRAGEAERLTVGDLSVDSQGNHWATLRDTKNGDSRSVPLSLLAVQSVTTGVGDQAPGDRVFAGLSRSTLSHLWVRCRSALRLPQGAVLHSLRHSRASQLVNAGVPLAHIQAWLGHRDVRTTLRYAHTDRASLLGALKATGGNQ